MKKMLKFTTPIWIAMMVNSLLGITDFYFLGKYSNSYLSIVGIAYVPFSFISSFLIGFGIEANRSRAREENLNIVSILVSVVIFSSLLATLSIFFSDYLLLFVTNTPNYLQIKTYFSLITLSIIPTSVLYICTGVLRGNGTPGKTLYFSVITVIINFLLDYLFIEINLFGDPLKGCGLATVIADSLAAAVYIIYFWKKKFLRHTPMNLQKFIRNSFTNTVDKIFSNSSLKIISSIFISRLDTAYSALYFTTERFFDPLFLFSYSYFEWVIYTRSKNIKNDKRIYFIYFIFLLACGLFFINYYNVNKTGVYYILIYICFVTLFFIERSLVALFFAEEKGKIVNLLLLSKNLLVICSLFLVSFLGHFTLLSFAIIDSVCLMIEITILRLLATKNEILLKGNNENIV
jgi:hypothetical protein